jgi:lipid A disaccharide synthetase
VPEERIRLKLINRGVPPKKVVTVGNLMVEGIKPTLAREEAAELWGLDPEADIVALLPGSRPYQVKYMMPFFLKVSELIKQEHPQTQFILALSPFTSKEELASSIQREDVGKYLDGSKGVLFVEPGANGGRIGEIISNEGLEIIVIEKKPYEVMATCDLALTVPGTKTAELACLGISTIVVVPLNKPEKLPIDGFFNWVGEIPLIGPPLKRAVVEALNKRIKFVSHPNIRSEKEIMPEIRGVISPEDISWPAIRLLKDAVERKRMSRQLQSVMGGKGASKRVVEEILAVFSETYSNK